MILIESNYGGGGTSGPQWYYSTATNRNQYIRKDTTAPTTEIGFVNSNRPNVRLNVDGYTVFAPTFSVNPNSVDFGVVSINTTTAYTNLTVSHSGAGTLNVSSVMLGGSDAGSFILDMNSNPTPWALTAGQSKTVKVAFNPMEERSYNAYLRFAGDVRIDHDVPLGGTGIDPTITIIPHTQSFDGTTFPPAGWISQIGSGASGWQRVASSTSPTLTPYSGAGMLYYNSFSLSAPANATLISPPIQASNSGNMYTGSFWMYRDGSNYLTTLDKVEVYTNASPSLTGATLLGTVHRSYTQVPVEAAAGWYQYTFEMGMGSRDIKYFLLKAVSAHGNNMNVDEITFNSVEGGTAPNPAISPNPANNATLVPISTNLSWSSGGGAPTGYKVYFGQDAENLEVVANQAETVFDPAVNLEFGKTYFWNVDPFNDFGNASDIAELPLWQFSTATGVAITPSPANNATGWDASNRLLNWADVTGASGYKVYVGTATGTYDLISGAEVLVSEYTHTQNWAYSTDIFWKVVTLNGSQEVDGTEWKFTTGANPTRPLPYLETFNASTSLPANWIGTFTVSATHGVASNGLYKNLYSYTPTANVVTAPVGPITANTLLEFDYRYMAYTSYPGAAQTLAIGDKLEVQLSTDGVNFETIYTIDSSNHVTSTSFATCGVYITQAKAAEGDIIKVKLLATWAAGDYYLDIDNVNFRHVDSIPVISVTPAEKDFGVVNLNTASAPQIFTVKNVGGGTLAIDPAITIAGDNADQYQLIDLNSYPTYLGPNETMTVAVTFTPTSEGTKSAYLKIMDDLSKNQTQIQLTGTGFDANINDFPYIQDFEASTFLPFGWAKIVFPGNDITRVSGTSTNHSPGGNYAARFSSFSSSIDYNQYLFTAPIEVTAPYTYLSFWHKKSGNYPETLEWGIATDTDPASFTWTPVTLDYLNFQKTEVNLSEYDGQTVYLGFHYYGDFQYYVYLDDIEIGTGSISVPGDNSVTGGDIPPELPGEDTGLPAVVYTVTATGVRDVVVANPGWGVDWYCWLKVGNLFYAGGNPIPAADPNWTFTGINFDAKGEAIIVLNDNQTLPVELSSFTATLTADMFVKIAWVAQSETNHLGYNILRGESNSISTALKINNGIIDEGTALGTQVSYSYADAEVDAGSTYYYWLESVDLGGTTTLFGPLSVLVTGDPNDPGTPELPTVTKLMNAFPNPFNPNTTLRYSLKEAGKVRIEIFNLKGQMVRSFSQDHSTPGYYQVSWDGKDAQGQKVSSGVYMYRMSSGRYHSTKKMVLAK